MLNTLIIQMRETFKIPRQTRQKYAHIYMILIPLHNASYIAPK